MLLLFAFFLRKTTTVNVLKFRTLSSFCSEIKFWLSTGLEKSTRTLVFTNALGCRAIETFNDFQCKLTFFPYNMPITFVMQGKCLFQGLLSRLEFIKCLSEMQREKTLIRLLISSLIWSCTVCLDLFGR